MIFRKNMTALFCASGILALILDSQTALTGAAAGMTLCLKSVLPSLFPFLFLCSVLTTVLWGKRYMLLSYLAARTGVPAGAESLLIAASLGGYPAGAQAVAASYAAGKLAKKDAEHLLHFCNNAGPAFLFGIVSAQFEEKSMVWALFIIHILAALWTGVLYRVVPSAEAELHSQNSSIPQHLNRSVKAMAVICGWIILFRILSEYLTRWFFCFFPEAVQVLLCGLLELSNGCCSLSQIGDASVRFLICSCMLSFGGLCIVMQTASVIEGLSIKPYLTGKLLQTIFSMILAAFYLQFGWITLGISSVLFAVVPKKTVDFQNCKMYNKTKRCERTQIHAVS